MGHYNIHKSLRFCAYGHIQRQDDLQNTKRLLHLRKEKVAAERGISPLLQKEMLY